MTDYSELERLAEAATPGPWSVDTQFNSGRDGAGDEIHQSFKSYVVGCGPDNNWKAIADTTHSDVIEIETDGDWMEGHSWDEQGRRNAAFIAAANPQTILALTKRVKELEEALKPFAKDASKAENLSPHNTIVHVTTCRVRDLRRARLALSGKGV